MEGSKGLKVLDPQSTRGGETLYGFLVSPLSDLKSAAQNVPSCNGRLREIRHEERYCAQFSRLNGWYTALLIILSCCFCLLLSGCGGTLYKGAVTGSLVASPSTVTFGTVPINQTASTTVSLLNGGSAPIQITQLNLKGQSFSVTDPSDLPVTIPAGGTYGLNVQFNPAGAGAATGQLTIANNSSAIGAPVINLSGTGMAGTAAASIAPTGISFGTEIVGNSSAAQTVTVTNTGALPLAVDGIGVAGANSGSFSATNNCGASLAAGVSCTIQVSFLPTTLGEASASLTVADSASGSPQAVPLSGTGSSALSVYWLAPSIGSVNALGTVVVPSSGKGTVQLLSPTIIGNKGPLVCAGTAWDSTGTSLSIKYTMGTATLNVVVQVTPTITGVNAQLDADQALITSVDMGNWAADLNTHPIAVPYYTADVWYSQSLPAYLNGWWDWHTTQATQLNGTAAQYLAKTDGTLNKLHELMEVTVSSDVDAVLPAPGNPASPFMSKLSGRTVFDIWDSGFSEIEQGLSDLGDYGITNCVGIIHNWQYDGYDNALPEHYPANPRLGGGAALQAAIAQGQADGCLMAVHENYVDYYPNYPSFNAASVTLLSNGSQVLSWLNPSTGIQSFAAKPSWMLTNAMSQSPLIHANYGTTADYLDVNSAAVPSWDVDMDASSPRAGMLTTSTQSRESLWAYERKTNEGPVLGEGANHWYYSGLLDGVEAQLGAGSVAMNLGETLPLFVDFDLLQIHPLQVNHGMGYYNRWTQSGTSSMMTTQMDAYRMQEIAFGHAPFLGNGTWSDVSRAFVESSLVAPVAASYGTALAASIKYQVNGAWATSSVAAQTGQFTQVQVDYNNGLAVVANASETALTWNGLTIPQYGWAAKSASLFAYTAQCGSTICDYAQTATTIFANARNQSDAEISFGYAAPSVSGITQGSGHSFTINCLWRVFRPLGTQTSYTAFVHFVNDSRASDSNEGRVFQGDHQPVPATSQWQVGQAVSDGPVSVTIPSSVPDGTYSIRIGLYDQATGVRLMLSGDNDGTERYIVGYLNIFGGGTQVSFTAPAPQVNDPRLNTAGTVVNFGTLQTDGMISLTQKNKQWVLRSFPRYRNVTVLLNSDNFTMPTIVETSGSANSTVIPLSKGGYWQLPTNGAKTYSWPVD